MLEHYFALERIVLVRMKEEDKKKRFVRLDFLVYFEFCSRKNLYSSCGINQIFKFLQRRRHLRN